MTIGTSFSDGHLGPWRLRSGPTCGLSSRRYSRTIGTPFLGGWPPRGSSVWLRLSCLMPAIVSFLDFSATESACVSQDQNLCLAAIACRFPSRMEVIKRHAPGDGLYPLCGVPKTRTHILFSCTTAIFLWSFVLEALGPDWEPWTWLGSSKPVPTRPGGGDTSSGLCSQC
jgi:hypothetical protein